MGRYINAGVHQEKDARIQPCHSKQVKKLPYSPELKKIGSEAQAPLPPDASLKLDEKGIKCIQQIVGSILYYARAVDMTVMTVLAVLSTIAIDQTKATEQTMKRIICYRLCAHKIYPCISSDHMRNFSNKILFAH